MRPDRMTRPWLKLFRVVNLPTVPGDVLVGAALVLPACAVVHAQDLVRVALVAVASCLLYMFGLVDNDIVGAATDGGRPIPDGQISIRAARIARAVCLALGVATSASAAFVSADGVEYAVMFAACQVAVSIALVAAIVAYKKRLDSLFENQALDIETDIEVMNTMLAREGLSGAKDFDI